jgi:transposase
VLTAIRGEVRTRSGRQRRPTAAVVDASSVNASPVAGPRGFQGANKADGVKHHLLVDSAGLLIAAVLTAADVQDRAAFLTLLRKAKRVAPTITHVWVDNGYTGSTVANAPGQGWSPCRRRVRPQTRPRLHRPATSLAGRTHQRLDQPLPPPRPPPRSHLNAHEGFPIPSQIDLLLRRLDSQLFDTL